MDGTVFREILDALNDEGRPAAQLRGPTPWAQWAANVTYIMHVRVYGPNGDGVGGWVDADGEAERRGLEGRPTLHGRTPRCWCSALRL